MKVSFVIDEDTLNKAKASFPNHLHLIILDKTERVGAGSPLSQSHGFKHYKGVTHDWDQEKWVDKILSHSNPIKLKNSLKEERINISYLPQ